MRITDLLDIRSIALDAAPKSKQETLDAAVALMVKSGKITDEDAYRAQVYAREEESTTGIGEGIAIPHGKCDALILILSMESRSPCCSSSQRRTRKTTFISMS